MGTGPTGTNPGGAKSATNPTGAKTVIGRFSLVVVCGQVRDYDPDAAIALVP